LLVTLKELWCVSPTHVAAQTVEVLPRSAVAADTAGCSGSAVAADTAG
jgi:hypothetical protein